MALAMEKVAADRERVNSDRGTDGLALNTWARKNRSDSISKSQPLTEGGDE